MVLMLEIYVYMQYNFSLLPRERIITFLSNSLSISLFLTLVLSFCLCLSADVVCAGWLMNRIILYAIIQKKYTDCINLDVYERLAG